MNVLDVNGLQKSFGSTRVLGGVSFVLGETEKIGLVGRNGCGKSTLFRILAGLEEPDGGIMAKKRLLTVGYLPQKPVFDPALKIRAVLESHLGEAREKLLRHRSIGEALAEARGSAQEKLLAEQDELHAWLDHHSAWNIGHRIEELCRRFSIPDPDAAVGTLSGGWNQRVALAGILLGQPELLLLDEPTNQIDAETVEWLEAHLKEYPGALLMVTHDRYFLDRVVSRMFELSDGALTTYTGGYSAYLEEKAARLERDKASQARLANLLRREEAWLRRGAKARTTKQKARIDRVSELRGQRTETAQGEVSFAFSAPQRLGSTVIETRALTLALGGKTLVSNLDFSLKKGDRIGILGPNGCGKTTLARAIVGEIAPTSGSVVIGKNTRIAYLDQGRTGLDESLSLGEALAKDDWVSVGGPDGEKRHKTSYLEDFLFVREDQRKPVTTLSGGERARLLLAKMLLLGANVLLLDEPTNDLDIQTLQVLDEALTDFPGSVLMVTHDRYFLDRVATGILHFTGEDGRVDFYEGNYEIFSRLRPSVPAAGAKRAEPKPAPEKPAEKPKPKALTFKEKKRLQEVEARLTELESRKGEVEGLLAAPPGGAVWQEIQKLSEELVALDAEILELLAEWEELEGKK